MSDRTKKEIFEKEIGPLVSKIYEICVANHMSFLSVVELTPDGQEGHAEVVSSSAICEHSADVLMASALPFSSKPDSLDAAAAMFLKLSFEKFMRDQGQDKSSESAIDQFLAMVQGKKS